MTRTVLLRVVPLLALIAGCSFPVRALNDPAADFSRLRTYAWLPLAEAAPADQQLPDRYFDRRLRGAVDTELRAKGYRPSEPSEQPDFLLNYRLSTTPESSLRLDPTLRFGGSAWLAWPGATAISQDSYNEGTLYLAVIDPPSRKMTWIGMTHARMVPSMSLERSAERLDTVVHEILARFPPGR